MIHFHESCQSFESFKRIHCPLSHCVSSLSSHASKSFCRVARCSKGIWRSLTSTVYIAFVSVSLSQSYGYYVHINPELCSEFHVIDVGLIMALLWRDYSCRHQLIIREIVLETNLVPWDLYASMTDSLALNIGSHNWPLIKIFHWVFNVKTSIHNQYIVLGYLGNHWHQWWSPSHFLMVHIIGW